MRFLAGAIGIFLLNVLILTFLVEILGFPTFQSQVFLTIGLAVLNYFFQKNAVFKSTNSWAFKPDKTSTSFRGWSFSAITVRIDIKMASNIERKHYF